MERYFAVNEISEAERLKATCVCLEGKTLNWYLLDRISATNVNLERRQKGVVE